MSWDTPPTTWLYDLVASVSGSGSASTLTMTEEEKAAAKERESKQAPFGFSVRPAIHDSRTVAGPPCANAGDQR